MARIKKRTGKDGKTKYTAEIRLKGYPPQSATFTRLTDAKKWVQDTESDIRRNRHFKTTEAKKHSLAEAIARYESDVLPVKYKAKEQLNRKPILQWWADEIGYTLMADLTPSLFAECRDKLKKTPSKKGGLLKSDTVKKYFDVMKNVLKCACNEWAWLDQSPLADGKVEMPELPQGRVRMLSDEERERLLKACRESRNEWLYLIVLLGLSTGMRKSEIMNLYWREPKNPPKETAWGVVDLEARYITLHQTKNDDRRRLPIVGPVYELLKQHRKTTRRLDTDLLFYSQKSPSQPVLITRAFETARDKAELVDFRFHDLRHTCASYLAMNGAKLPEISAVTGHRDLKSLQRYIHLTQNHIDGVLGDMLNKRLGGL